MKVEYESERVVNKFVWWPCWLLHRESNEILFHWLSVVRVRQRYTCLGSDGCGGMAMGWKWIEVLDRVFP